MERWLYIACILLCLTSTASAASFTLEPDGCGDAEPLFSISNRTNANAAGPTVYQGYTGSAGQQGLVVCGSGVGETSIKQSCRDIWNPVLSFYDADSGSAHLSPVTGRNTYVLCSARLATTVFRTCPGTSTPIVSIYDPIENHVAEPGYYEWQICGKVFENVTLAYEFTMQGNTSFFLNDNQSVGSSVKTNDTGQATAANASILSGIIGNNRQPQQVSIQTDNDRVTSTLTQYGTINLDWFLPLTPGTQADILERIPLIGRGQFLDELTPNFGFDLRDETVVNVIMSLQSIDIVNSVRLAAGIHNIMLENRGESPDGTPQVRINATQ